MPACPFCWLEDGRNDFCLDLLFVAAVVKTLDDCREVSICITKLQEAVMWLGMDLKRIGETNPYPNSKDPSTGTKIDPTADNLKF